MKPATKATLLLLVLSSCKGDDGPKFTDIEIRKAKDGTMSSWVSPMKVSYDLSPSEVDIAKKDLSDPNNMLKLYYYYTFYHKNQKESSRLKEELIRQVPDIGEHINRQDPP